MWVTEWFNIYSLTLWRQFCDSNLNFDSSSHYWYKWNVCRNQQHRPLLRPHSNPPPRWTRCPPRSWRGSWSCSWTPTAATSGASASSPRGGGTSSITSSGRTRKPDRNRRRSLVWVNEMCSFFQAQNVQVPAAQGPHVYAGLSGEEGARGGLHPLLVATPQRPGTFCIYCTYTQSDQ